RREDLRRVVAGDLVVTRLDDGDGLEAVTGYDVGGQLEGRVGDRAEELGEGRVLNDHDLVERDAERRTGHVPQRLGIAVEALGQRDLPAPVLVRRYGGVDGQRHDAA